MSITAAQGNLLIAMAQGAEFVIGTRGCRWMNARWNKVAGKPRRNVALALIRAALVEIAGEYGGVKRYRISDSGMAACIKVSAETLTQTSKLPITARDVLRALRRYYLSDGWVMATEVTIPSTSHYRRRIDAFFVSPYRGETIAVEVKISRADWLAELSDPDKLKSSMRLSHFTYVAAPDGIVHEDELTNGVGHFTYLPLDKTIVLARSADRHEPDEPTWNLVGRVAAGALRAAREVP